MPAFKPFRLPPIIFIIYLFGSFNVVYTHYHQNEYVSDLDILCKGVTLPSDSSSYTCDELVDKYNLDETINLVDLVDNNCCVATQHQTVSRVGLIASTSAQISLHLQGETRIPSLETGQSSTANEMFIFGLGPATANPTTIQSGVPTVPLSYLRGEINTLTSEPKISPTAKYTPNLSGTLSITPTVRGVKFAGSSNSSPNGSGSQNTGSPTTIDDNNNITNTTHISADEGADRPRNSRLLMLLIVPLLCGIGICLWKSRKKLLESRFRPTLGL